MKMIKSIPLLVLLTTLGCAPERVPFGDLPVEDGGVASDHPINAHETGTIPDAPVATELGVPGDSGPADTGPTPEDSQEADSGPQDSGTTDAGSPDVGPPPVDAPEVGPVDAGPTDTGVDVPVDTGTPDTGSLPVDVGTDRGPADTGPVDTGAPEVAVDTGPSCPSARTLCTPGCMDLSSDPQNCGACGRVCSLPGAVSTCSLSRCDIGTCLAGYANCDGVSSTGCEIDIRQDARNCGACGNICQAPEGGTTTCEAGSCVPDCGSGSTLVGTRCVPDRIRIPGATFTMGAVGALNSQPFQEQVRVTGFLMDRAEVTVARFRLSPPEGSPFPGTGSNCTWGGPPGSRDNHPLNCVSWVTARGFCLAQGGDLPTEAQWELAARGTMARGYPWGSGFMTGTGCWNRSGTCAVGTFPLGNTPEGLVDMAGNVMEWTRDRYAPYTDTFCWGGMNRNGDSPCPVMTSTSPRTVRGGAWNSLSPASYYMHSGGRSGEIAPAPSIGFRCVYPL